MLTATDDRSSHIKNSKNKKVILLNCCTLTYDDDVQRYSNITFLLLLFLMCELRSSVAVNMCIKCSFFTLILRNAEALCDKNVSHDAVKK